MNCCTVVLCVCTVNIVFLWLSVTGTLLYRCFCTLTNERSNERMPTRGQIWGQRQFFQLITISAAAPSHGPPSPLFLFSRFLFIWSICVCFSEFVSEFTCLGASGSFWAGVWSCVLSSIANKPSVTSVCLWLGFGLLLLTLFSTGFLFVSQVLLHHFNLYLNRQIFTALPSS